MIPWELIKRGIEATHPYSVFMVRSMLAVPFFEKALYEMPEEQVTPDAVTALADSIEKDVEGGLAGRSAQATATLTFASRLLQHLLLTIAYLYSICQNNNA